MVLTMVLEQTLASDLLMTLPMCICHPTPNGLLPPLNDPSWSDGDTSAELYERKSLRSKPPLPGMLKSVLCH